MTAVKLCDERTSLGRLSKRLGRASPQRLGPYMKVGLVSISLRRGHEGYFGLQCWYTYAGEVAIDCRKDLSQILDTRYPPKLIFVGVFEDIAL